MKPIEVLIEDFIQLGIDAYKKLYRGCEDGRKLDRHQDVKVGDAVISCWRELSVYQMGLYVKELCPDSFISIDLDGNDSTLQIEVTSEEISNIEKTLEDFLSSLKLV